MKKSLSLLASIALVTTSLISLAPAAQASPQANTRFSTITESRNLTQNSNFQAEADERAVRITAHVELSSAQYAAIGANKKLTARMVLKNGSATVGRENSVNFSGAISNPSSGSNTVTTNSNTGAVTIYVNLEANLLPATNYQVSVELLVDGTLRTITTDYTLSSLRGEFNKVGKSITTSGAETNISFNGQTCISASGYGTLTAGDVLEARVLDSASNTYSMWFDARRQAGMTTPFTYNNTSNLYELTLTQQMIDERFAVSSYISVSSPAAATYDPTISLKEVGSNTELSEACATAPAAPTLTATATGLNMTVDPTGANAMICYIADASSPGIWIQRNYAFSPQTTCIFNGLKRGNYVGWTERESRISQTNSTTVISDPSPKTASVNYAGGNANYRTFSGTSGGSGQGSLTLSNIDYVGSDFNTERRGSDGNGGVLVATIHAGDNEVKIRRLTPTGMSATFGGSGEVTVTLPPVNIRTGTPNIGWYGTGRDKWMTSMTVPFAQTYDGFGGGSSLTVFVTGDYAGTNQTTNLFSSGEIGRFCANNVTGADNSVWSASLGQVVSAPTADPLITVNCEIRHGQTGSFYSTLPFLATITSAGLEFKAALGDEPTSSEKCTISINSAVNSGATGSEVMIASFQRTWNPSGNECWLFNSSVPATSAVSRDLFTVTSAYARTAARDVMTVTGTNEPVLGFQSGMGASPTMRLIVSGPNTHLMTSEVSGSSPNQVIKYRMARLTNSSFGVFEQQPFLNVNSTDSFASGTNFSQISDYSENQAGSVLISRSDFTTGSTAARVDLSTGALTSYQQMASTGTGMLDGGSLILGNSSGALNFYGITSRTTAVLGQWVTTGAFDPALSQLPINQGASNTGVSAPSMGGGGGAPAPGPAGPAAAPYTGPIVKAPGLSKTVTRGNKLKLEGSSLAGVTKVTVAGKDAKVKVNSAGEIEIIVPSDLPNGTYDLIVTSASGVLTVQDAIKVANFASVSASTKLIEDTVKVYYFNAVGAGKVQIMHNGKEVAWVNATTDSDSKLRDGYLVRTINLEPGKNVIEIFVDGVRVKRVAHTN
jgi:hypothetical protein